MRQDNDQLIKELSKDLKPVKVLPNPAKTTQQWLFVCFGLVAVSVFLVQAYYGFYPLPIENAKFWVEAGALLGLGVFSIYSLALSRVPGLENNKINNWLYAIAGLWLASHTWLFIDQYMSSAYQPIVWSAHTLCSIFISGFSLIVSGFLVKKLNKGAVLKAKSSSVVMAISGTSLALLGSQLVCPMNNPEHMFSKHLIPVVVIVAGTFLLKDKLFQDPSKN